MSPIERTPPGGGSTTSSELDYVQVTTNTTVTATSAPTAQAWIDGNAVTYDGATRVKIEVFCCAAQTLANGQELIVELYDGATDLGNLLAISDAASQFTASIYGAIFLTPSAASHTYHAKAWKAGAGTNPVLNAGAGGANAFVPAWYRITRA